MNDNSILVAFVVGSLLIAALCLSFSFVLKIQKKKQNEFYALQLQQTLQHQLNLIETRTSVQEESMKIISREIHDCAVQDLIALQTKLSILKNNLPELTTHSIFSEIEEQTDQIKQELRNISHSLHNEQIKKYGLFEMMQKELNLLQQKGTLNISINIIDSEIRMPDMTEILVFRIFQEGIHNVIKHAEAKKMIVNFFCNDDQFILEIIDDGKGFDMEKVKKEGGIGMHNMNVRATALQSKLLINAQEDQGCHLKLIIPKMMYSAA